MNTARIFYTSASIALMIGAACLADSKRMPHPPDSQPPAFSPNMVVHKTPPSTVPVQRPIDFMPIKAGIKRPNAEPAPAAIAAAPVQQPVRMPAATPRTAPAGAKQIAQQPAPAVPAATAEIKAAEPVKLSGYVVFVAGMLLLFRKVD